MRTDLKRLSGDLSGVTPLATRAPDVAAAEMPSPTRTPTSAAGDQWDIAERHFETALRQAHDIPSKLAQPETRRWDAWMLLDRDAPGDRDRACTLLNEAIELYRTIGMPKHVEMAERMLQEAGRASVRSAALGYGPRGPARWAGFARLKPCATTGWAPQLGRSPLLWRRPSGLRGTAKP